MRRPLLLVGVLWLFASLATTARAETIIDLGPVRTFPPVALNDSRVVVGGSPMTAGNQPSPNGTYVYYHGAYYPIPQFLAPARSRGSGGADINDGNLVVGFSTTDAGNTAGFIEPHPFTWQFDPTDPTAQPALTALATIPSFDGSGVALGVNNAGDVVGQSAQPLDATGSTSETTYRRAALWPRGGTALQRLEPSASGNTLVGEASDLNDKGTIIGALDVNTAKGALWAGSAHTRTTLPARPPETVPDGAPFTGHPINSAGDYILNPPDQKVHLAGGGVVALPAGFTASTIADNGRVFGALHGAATVVEPGGETTDLNTLNPPGSPFSSLTRANDVNKLGDVLGVGTVNGVTDGFLLLADAWIVNDTGDAPDTDTTDGQCLTAAGRCTLRAALQQTNATGGAKPLTIGFAIKGTPSIAPATPLPPLTREAVLIDGRTQAGGTVTLDGAPLASAVAGLRILAGHVNVKGMTISGFGGPGVQVGADDTSVSEVTIGDLHTDEDRCAFPCNTITGDHGGVAVLGSTSTAVHVVGNRLTGDGAAPIDLGGDGPTPDDESDKDEGPNARINFPVGVTAAIDPVTGDQLISGAITPAQGSVDVDVYSQSTPGVAAPTSYLGEVQTGPAGGFVLTVPKAAIDPASKFFSATVSDDHASTSELSAVCGDPDGNGDPDDDGDGLCDSWEKNGLDYDGDGTVDLTFPGADPEVKDVYLEVDSMHSPTRPIAPTPAALDQVVKAFANAPVDGGKGIKLHIDLDETNLAEEDPIHFSENSGPDSMPSIRDGEPDTPCDGSFGTAAERSGPNCWAVLGAKHLTTRWALFADTYTEAPRSSGRANGIGGTSLAVTLAARDDHNLIVTGGGAAICDGLAACRDNVNAATLMHELGHLLGLHHGGGDDQSFKPNYLSIMNYAFIYGDEAPDRTLDYSRWKLDTLNETSVDESAGILGGKPYDGLLARFPHTVYTTTRDGHCKFTSAPSAGAIDWDHDGTIAASAVGRINDSRGARDGAESCQLSNALVLESFDDWHRLRYSFRDQQGFQNPSAADATQPPEPTIDEEAVAASQIDTDGDGVSNADQACRTVPRSGFADANGNGIIDACETPGAAATPTPTPGSPAATPTPRPGGAADRTPPVISKLRLSPARFRAAAKGASLAKRTGARLSLTVSEPATLTFSVQQLSKGHRKGKHCRVTKHAGKACTVVKRLSGSFTVTAARAGAVRATFTGRLRGRKLKRGRYRLVVSARDAAGNASVAAATPFRIR